MQLFADERPFLDICTRGWDLQAVVLYVTDQGVNGIAKGTHQDDGWRHQQHEASEHQQRRGAALFAAHFVGQDLMQGIDSDRQDQGPEHQGKEGRKDLVAQHDHGEDQASTNQDVKQPGGKSIFEFFVRLIRNVHVSSPCIVLNE